MATTSRDTIEVGYDEFCGALAAKDLQPLWSQAANLLPKEPIPATLPWLWRWSSLLPLAVRAGELITIDRGGERRVLALANPGLKGLPFTSSTLWGAIQYLGPHETAPAHRHTPSAIRFVIDGQGVWTTVNGDATDMTPGDLVLTPSWNWHDHANPTDAAMVWFDGLDLPFMAAVEAVFFENYPELMQAFDGGHNRSELLYGGVATKPLGASAGTRHSPLLLYRYAETSRTLARMQEADPAPMVSLEYINPTTGGPAMPTLGCEMHRLRPNLRTPSARKVGSSVYVAFKGSGATVINGRAFEWERGDVFVTPSWATVDHQAYEPSDLFAVTDRPILEALHIYREEVLAQAQIITGSFQPK